MFNFKGLVSRFGTDKLTYIKYKEPYYNELNEYIEGEPIEYKLEGAVTNLSTDDLKLDIGGTFNYDDRKLYCYKYFKKGDKIKHKGIKYTIMNDMDYSEFDEGLHIYYMKRGERS